MSKRISILGVSGSIGDSSLNIVKNFKELSLIAVAVNRSIDKLLEIIDSYELEYAAVMDRALLKERFGSDVAEYKGVKIYGGIEGILRICEDRRNDIILNAIAGKAGLIPSLKVLESGIDLALANKESIVCAGELMKRSAEQHGAAIIPVDSEHSAISQLLEGKKREHIEKIHITASGGPFLKLPKAEWERVTVADALKHPTWSMGKKISIDSSTMANKGLEVIEAHYLFGFDYDMINVLIHPQSLIHSMVETIDGEIMAHVGPKDMSLPIQCALFYPEMRRNSYNRLDLTKALTLELLPVDYEKFKMLDLAFYSGRKGGLYPAFYNSANEYLVSLFLAGKIGYLEIERVTERALTIFEGETLSKGEASLENIKAVDSRALTIVEELTTSKL